MSDPISYMYSRHILVSVCDLNQWALDFDGNYERIRASTLEAKSQGSVYRLGPELETCGYSCEDHFLELDTLHHNYEVLAKLLSDKELFGIIMDIGCLVHHNGVRYNARAICLDGQIICIRPKAVLANDSLYHEGRWFTSWKKNGLEDWSVPRSILEVINQKTVPIGICLIQFLDTCIGSEICEELFVPNNLHQVQVLNGAEIITNGSGSHFQIGKMMNRLNLVLSATKRCGCAYLYSNLTGCDGGRLFFDGGSFISSCGKLLHISKRFELSSKGFTVVSAFIDLDEVFVDVENFKLKVKGKRSSTMSWASVAAKSIIIPKINIDKYICQNDVFVKGTCYKKRYDDSSFILKHTDEKTELIMAPICWLWDYLKRSGMDGLYLSISGGADSTAVMSLVFILCHTLFEEIQMKKPSSEILLDHLRCIIKDKYFSPKSARDICHRILVTSYMPSRNSSVESANCVKEIVEEMNSFHYELPIDKICQSITDVAINGMNIENLKFLSEGGTHCSDIALQNIQARTRMILGYVIAQLHQKQISNSTKFSKRGGNLLVLGTSNADECIRGYFTKYDSSSADINMIGDLGKEQIRTILEYASEKFKFKSIANVLKRVPTAELRPKKSGDMKMQTDEDEMGLTYKQLSFMRHLRKVELYGPLSMFRRLLHYWYSEQNEDKLTNEEIANKVKTFFIHYAKNRHKTTILPPAVHLDSSTLEDNRGDMRPFLYNIAWKWQFKCIDSLLSKLSENDNPNEKSNISE